MDLFFCVYVMSKGSREDYAELENLKNSHAIVGISMSIWVLIEDRQKHMNDQRAVSRSRTCHIGFMKTEHVNERPMFSTHDALRLDIFMVGCGSYATFRTEVTFR